MRAQGREHSVILMAELGDLREGVWGREALEGLCLHVERELPHLRLAGVGANLGCYGSIRCTTEKMEELVSLAEGVERSLGRRLELISGGATNAYVLMERGGLPARINHLRIGGGMVAGPGHGGKLRGSLRLHRQGRLHPQGPGGGGGAQAQPPGGGDLPGQLWGGRPLRGPGGAGCGPWQRRARWTTTPPPRSSPGCPASRCWGPAATTPSWTWRTAPCPVRAGDILEFDLRYPAMAFLTAGRDVEIRCV